MTAQEPLIRIERGTLDDDGIAVLTALLLTRTGRNDQPRPTSRTTPAPLWSAVGPHARYRSPASWQR
ncbi:acyl-CoA carboxylase subunit epsilon [Streptomyces alanosinicus]|nr:acyl-CoA carboxylase subunit epsilon [Streptomyces alanosinicus]